MMRWPAVYWVNVVLGVLWWPFIYWAMERSRSSDTIPSINHHGQLYLFGGVLAPVAVIVGVFLVTLWDRRDAWGLTIALFVVFIALHAALFTAWAAGCYSFNVGCI